MVSKPCPAGCPVGALGLVVQEARLGRAEHLAMGRAAPARPALSGLGFKKQKNNGPAAL